MGFLREQRSKWRTRHHSACDSDAASRVLTSPALDHITFAYAGGPLGLTLQRSKSRWVDDVGPTKISWAKDRRLGITFYERPSSGVDHAIAIKDLVDDARLHPAICVGMELIGVNGEPIAGLALASVMNIIRSSASPCELAFTPPPSPIVVGDVSEVAAAHGVVSGHVLVAVNDTLMVGCSLQEASEIISVATRDAPVVLRFAPLHAVYQGRKSDDGPPGSNDSTKKSLRNTLCIAAVAAVLTV